MGRPLRFKIEKATYHITSRTNGKRLYIKKKQDHKSLCLYLNRIRTKYNVIIYGFTPMNNHFHLIVKMPDGVDLSQFMCEFKTAYAKHYNIKYNTSGHFWGDRFKSTIIQEDRHILACLRYIDRNPVKAGLVNSPDNWFYHTYRFYAYGQQHEILPIRAHITYLELARSQADRQRIYREFVIQQDEMSDQLHGTLPRMQFLGTTEFIQACRKKIA